MADVKEIWRAQGDLRQAATANLDQAAHQASEAVGKVVARHHEAVKAVASRLAKADELRVAEWTSEQRRRDEAWQAERDAGASEKHAILDKLKDLQARASMELQSKDQVLSFEVQRKEDALATATSTIARLEATVAELKGQSEQQQRDWAFRVETEREQQQQVVGT